MLTALENRRVPGPLWQDTTLIQADRVRTLQLSLSRDDREYLCYFHKASPAAIAPPS